MTGIRECQALLSLKLIDRSLQHVILNAPTENNQSSNLISSSCPPFVPPAMWKTFQNIYNDSQLCAIRRVCSQYSNKDAAITLLQGPPGTGKTKTILGVVSVFLCGALFQENRGKVKIVAGASFHSGSSRQNSISNREENGMRYINNIQGNGETSASSSSSSSSSGRQERADSIDGVWSKKPRVLICAPSNIAVDELVFRLVTQVCLTLLLLVVTFCD